MALPELIRILAVVGALAVMLAGLWLVAARLKAKNQGFGPNAVKALGLVLLVPALIIIPVALPQFQSETVAALLGTIAGYVLSQSRPEE